MRRIKAKKLNNIFDKTLGLIFYKIPEPVYFSTRFGIHTFGLNYPIDVIICDSGFTVKILGENIMPNRIFFWNPWYDKVIELPGGMVKKLNIKIGRVLVLSDDK